MNFVLFRVHRGQPNVGRGFEVSGVGDKSKLGFEVGDICVKSDIPLVSVLGIAFSMLPRLCERCAALSLASTRQMWKNTLVITQGLKFFIRQWPRGISESVLILW